MRTALTDLFYGILSDKRAHWLNLPQYEYMHFRHEEMHCIGICHSEYFGLQ